MKTTLFLSFLSSLAVVGVLCYYEVRPKDSFDEIKHRMDRVSAWNCEIHRLEEMFLPNDTISHLPDIKDVNVNPVFPNRTALLHLHNLALSRAFFFSYISQARFIRPAINDTYDPGMMYYFLSTVADVSSNPNVNASAIYFAPNSAYTPSYRGFFNKTLPYFAPRTIRLDDYNDQIHIERISTLNTFATHDLGAFPNGTLGSDYTSEEYRINEWYTAWLPDNVVGRHDTKTTYQVEIRYSNNTNETFTFHGPPGADENPGPVKWRRPYFDCGRSNKWLFSAIVPIADIYPRHTRFRHIEYPTYTAVAVLEMDLERIDINQCPKGEGNSGPNYFADTAYCKKETTECEPLDGWGFRRGGYQCRCKPGYRLPPLVRTPYLGEIIERASPEQYYDGYDCMKIGWVQKLPIQWEKAPKHIQEKYLDMYHEYRKDNVTFGPNPFHMENRKKRLNVHDAVDFIFKVKPSNCKKFNPQDLTLNGDVTFGAEKYFENEAKMAVRLANFISAFLQLSDPTEVFSGKRVADRPLTEDQMMGETLALVLGNSRIWAAGTYWDRNKFPNRTLFAPYAFKEHLNTRKFKLEDMARLNSKDEVYTNKEWFKFLKQRWSTNLDSLETYNVKLQTRYNSSGEHLNKHEKYPTSYKAANLEGGYWLKPYFDCGGKLNKWIVSYASPFFGPTSVKEKLEFKGAVIVSMDLKKLDINQCPSKASAPNAFKGTHKCDRSSYCVPIMGRGLEVGGYKCECIQGYEYPFEDLITYYDGQLVEAEFLNLVVGNATRFDMFKCRLAGASSIQHNFVIILSLLLFLRFIWY